MIFPFLNQKLDFGKEAEEHKGIHDALDRFGALIAAARADKTKFDPSALAQILEKLREPLVRRSPSPHCVLGLMMKDV